MALTAAQVAAELARVQRLHQQDHDAEAREALEALVKALPADLGDEERFAVLWQWADLRSHADDHAAAVEAYLACAPLLDRLDKPRGKVVSANNRGYHLAMLGRREEALAALREAREAARLAGQPMLLRAYGGLATWHAEWGQLDEAESAARVGVQQARAWGDAGELGSALLTLARVLARSSRTDRALLHFTEAAALLEQAGRPEAAAEAKAGLSALAAVPPGAR
jgi:tetratricopeptide (TPR) repeat protein